MEQVPKYKLIGLSGKIGAGKDTLGLLLNQKYNDRYTLTSFALNVKKVVAILTNTTIEDNLTREGKASVPLGFDKSLGSYQQIVGVGMRNLLGADIWIKSALGQNLNGNKIVTDVRFPEEVVAIEALGGIVIRLNRTTKLVDDGRDHNHISEIALDNYEFAHVVQNDGSLEELLEAVCQILTAEE